MKLRGGQAKPSVVVIEGVPATRELITRALTDQNEVVILATAGNFGEAILALSTHEPDVVVIDADLAQHQEYVRLYSLIDSDVPVLLTSAQPAGSRTVAMQEAAGGRPLAHCLKPSATPHGTTGILIKIHALITGKVLGLAVEKPHTADAILPLTRGAAGPCSDRVILVGASTGGTEAVKEFLCGMPASAPPILVTQHMPDTFTKLFAERLDSLCTIRVKEATHGEPLAPGHAYIAPGHSHLLLKRHPGRYITELNAGPPVNRHRPSVDVLFRSAANFAGNNAIGVLLTGMGKDGAVGMLEMKQSGIYNFAQDAESCVVFGMPKEAIRLGAVDEVVSIQQMASRVLARLAGHPHKPLTRAG